MGGAPSAAVAPEEGSLLSDAEADAAAVGVRLPSRAESAATVEQTFRDYTILFMFHGCCCEAPAAMIEGVVRGVLWLCIAACYAAASGATCARAAWARAAFSAREALLFLAAALSLAVPGMGLAPYAGFSAENAWELRPIPTVAGAVDPRRFVVFRLGQGADAANVASGRYPLDTLDALPAWGTPVVARYAAGGGSASGAAVGFDEP